jgi:hypothetical protein
MDKPIRSSELIGSLTSHPIHPRLSLLLLFLACYALCAGFFQARSETPPWEDGSPIEYFTSGLLWMLSLIGLLIADTQPRWHWRFFFWLASSAAFAVLAMDEIFQFHEQTGRVAGDDDHSQVIQWVGAGAVLSFIDRIERPTRRARWAIFVGFFFHSLYMLVEIGDGDYFRLPVGRQPIMGWVEEFLELFALASYFVGFTLHYTTSLWPSRLFGDGRRDLPAMARPSK